jgi:hypothetical protein
MDPLTDAQADRPPRPVYYLVAPAGFPNYGDELIAATWLRHLAEVAPEADVWLDTHSPGPATALLSELHPRVRFTDTLWRLCGDAPSEDPWQVAAWVRAAVDDPGLAPRWFHGIDLLSRVDVLHVLGGGYINKLWPKHIGLLAGVAAAKARSGARSAMTGQGLLPIFDDALPLLRTLVDHFDVVEARDTGSAALLDLTAGVDDAFLARDPGLYADGEVPEVMLCLQSDLVDVGAGKLAGAVLSMLRSWKVAPSTVGVVEGIPRIDREVYALLERELPGARFYPFPEVWGGGLPVSAEQTWISTRFHPHLMAAAAGASGVAVSVHPDYYATKHRSLTDLGSNWTLVEDLAEVPDRPRDGGFADGVVDGFRAGKLVLAQAIYAPVPRPAPEPEPPPEPEAAPAPEVGRVRRGLARLKRP